MEEDKTMFKEEILKRGSNLICSVKSQFYTENLFLMLKEVHVLFVGVWCHGYQIGSTQKPDMTVNFVLAVKRKESVQCS